MRSKALLLIAIFIIPALLLSSQRADILTKNSAELKINKGSESGVKIGMNGYIWGAMISGGKKHYTKIGKFKVVSVNSENSKCKITATGQGISWEQFEYVIFNSKLIKYGSGKQNTRMNTIPSDKSIEWYLDRGDSFFNKGSYKNAMRYYKMVLNIDPLDPVGLKKYQKAKIAQKRAYKKALAVKARAKNKKRYKSYLVRAGQQYKSGNLKECFDYLSAAYRVYPYEISSIQSRISIILKNNKKAKGLLRKHQDLFSIVKSKCKGVYNKYFFDSGIEWVKVEGGSFYMGSNNGVSDEKPVHSVRLDSFYISKYEVTFVQYDKFCDATGRSKPGDKGWGRGKRPVINVSWNDAMAFCKWLSKKTGKSITLPTEAQWEFAARGGNKSKGYKYSGSDKIDKIAWYWSNSNSKTHPVGQKQPNELGIYDMSGNVWEWCFDWYDNKYYKQSPGSNPPGPASGTFRVCRGGGWRVSEGYLRSARRDGLFPSCRRGYLGFRLVKTN